MGVNFVLDVVPYGTIVGNMETRKRIHISLTPTLDHLARVRAEILGLPVSTYIVSLVVADLNKHTRAGVRSAKEEK